MKILAIVSLTVFSLSAVADNGVSVFLMPCPDCGKTVSKRALMCPACGCDGKVIRGAAKALTEKAKPKEPDRMVLADFGKTKCKALPVKMEDRGYVVLPLEKVLDLETLVFSFVSTNVTIGYSIPEVAIDQPFIRFPITETNLIFASAETNVCSELVTPNAVKLSSVAGWQKIQPKALKNHGKILLKIKAGEKAKLPPTAHSFDGGPAIYDFYLYVTSGIVIDDLEFHTIAE